MTFVASVSGWSRRRRLWWAGVQTLDAIWKADPDPERQVSALQSFLSVQTEIARRRAARILATEGQAASAMVAGGAIDAVPGHAAAMSVPAWQTFLAETFARVTPLATARAATHAGRAPYDPVVWMPEIAEWMRRHGATHVKQIGQTTRTQLRALLAEGIAQGEHAAVLARRITKAYLMDIGPQRAEAIAETEVGTAVNLANFVSAAFLESLGVKQIKIWRSLMDGRERADHHNADRQRRALHEPFQVGNVRMLYPHDASLGAGPEQIIRCRCAAIYLSEAAA